MNIPLLFPLAPISYFCNRSDSIALVVLNHHLQTANKKH